MATISSLGVGSSLPLDTLLEQLMTVERQPITQIETRKSSTQTKLSAYGTLKSSLASLQTAAEALNTKAKFSAFTATVADTTVASAAASGSAAAGSYSLEVSQLAQSQKVKSAGYAATSSTIATGTFTIDIGKYAEDGTTDFTASKTTNITIDSSNNTLAGLRDAINSANAGVTATIVNDGGSSPYRLVLTASASGTANSFRTSGLSGFSYTEDATPAPSNDLSSIQVAKDAKFKLDGIDIVKSSNVVTDAIDGVTLTLSKTNVGAATTLNVNTDVSGEKAKIDAFIKAYNDVIGLMKSQSAYNETNKTAGPLNGDATLRSIQSQLRGIVGGTLGGSGMTRLSDAGIKINVDGTLTADSTKLEAALKDPTKDVGALFAKVGSTSGFADQVASAVKEMIDSDGLLTSRTDGLNSTIKNFDKRIEEMEKRLELVETRYKRQFAALDTMIAGLNSTSSYLAQQLEKLA